MALATGVSVGRAGQEISCVTPPGTRAEVWVPLQVINVDPTGIGMVTVDEGFRYHTVFTRPVIEKFVPTHGGEGTKVYVQGMILWWGLIPGFSWVLASCIP